MPQTAEPPWQEFWGPFGGPSDISEEDLRHYEKQCNESQGFDVDYLPLDAGNVIRPLVPLTPARIETHRLKPLTNKAVEFYNSKNPTDQIKDPRIVKANYIVSGPMTYYITFKAKGASGKWKLYQTLVDADAAIDDSEIEFCRLKPKKEKKKKEKKRKRNITKGEASTNTCCCYAASSSADPANTDPDPAHEADEAVKPLNNTGMERNKEKAQPKAEIDVLYPEPTETL